MDYWNNPTRVFPPAKPGGGTIGVPLYQSLNVKTKRSLIKGGQQRWREEEWQPQRITATWAQDVSWGYRPPIYMLSGNIRLEIGLEIIINQTATCLELRTKQQSQMHAAI